MPAFAAQYQFAAAFIVFLVALAGLALVVLRETLTVGDSARLALGAGFLGIGGGAFLEGSLLVDDGADPRLLGLRLAGVAGLVAGSLPWRGPHSSRLLLWTGAAALALAVPVAAADAPIAAATVGALGGLLLGGGLLLASRVAIAARVAASAAATLLLVVLVLSVALSTVLARTVEDQALADLDDRAVTEAGAIEQAGGEVIDKASVVASLLARVPDQGGTGPALLARIDPRGGPTSEQRAAVQRELDRISTDVYPRFGVVYVSESGQLVAGSGAPLGVLEAATRADVVGRALQAPRAGRSDTPVIEGQALVVGVRPIDLADQPIGAVVGVSVLDDDYLDVRSAASGADALALVANEGVVAQAGPLPSGDAVTRLSRVVLGSRSQETATTDARFAAARAVRPTGGGRAVLAVIASRSTDRVDSVRADLFRTFFVIAFGGTVLALLLAAVVGDRIGRGIRRLTVAAEAIQRGQIGVRSDVRSADEVGVLGATFDSMSASIEAQRAALVEAAERVEAVVAGMGEALVALDADGRVTDFNAAAEELFGLRAADVRGVPVADILTITSEEGAPLSERIAGLEPERWSALASATTPSVGREVPVALTVGPLRGPDGAVVGGVVVLRDLRGEREVERMKRHFLSRVGHELRTPLTPLIGYTQLLAGRDLPPERARMVYGSIVSSAKRLERIVEMLEFFAALDAGRPMLRPERVDVRQLLEGVVARRSSADDVESHDLARRVARATPDVEVDPRWMGRALDELVDNAVKFSPDGGRITLTARLSPFDDGSVEIAVRDRGVGMDPEAVDGAFREWAQGDESDTRSFGGLGLGLALVERVVEYHGGRVDCETAPGKGTTFSLVLPAVANPEPGPTPTDRRPRRRRSPSAGPPAS